MTYSVEVQLPDGAFMVLGVGLTEGEAVEAAAALAVLDLDVRLVGANGVEVLL